MRYLATLLLASLSHYCLAQTWQIAGDSQFEPYSYTQGHNMPAQGLDVELVEAILKEANIDYELRLYPWERVKLLLEQSRIDMAFPFAGTPSRHNQYQLAGPLRSGSTVFMVSKELPLHDWQQFSDLQHYTIGQIRGYSYAQDYDSAPLTRNMNADTPQQLISMLLAGRFEIIIGDRIQLLHLAQQQGVLNQVRILPTAVAQMPRFVAFEKTNQQSAQRFSQALENLRKSGRLQSIEQRWLERHQPALEASKL